MIFFSFFSSLLPSSYHCCYPKHRLSDLRSRPDEFGLDLVREEGQGWSQRIEEGGRGRRRSGSGGTRGEGRKEEDGRRGEEEGG